MVLNLTEEFRVTEAGISLSADSDCNEQRAAAAGQGIVRKFAFFFWSILKGDICSVYFFHDIFSNTYITTCVFEYWR